jgi:hypothetical protein
MTKQKPDHEEILAQGLALMAAGGKLASDDREVVSQACGALIHAVREVGRLKHRIAQLEARPPLKYLGVWQSGRSYEQGSFTTCDGSLWHCDRDHPLKPGVANSGWTLAVKRGKDAR